MWMRYLFAFGACLGAILVSQLASYVPADLPSRGFVVGLLHEIGEAGKLAIALLLAVYLVFEKALELMGPFFEKQFTGLGGSVRHELENGAHIMGPFFEKQFTGLGESVRQGLESGMRTVSEKVQDALAKNPFVWSQAQAETEIVADVSDPILIELVRAGNIEEALKRAKSKGDRLTVLVLSQAREDWKEAAKILLSTSNVDPKYYSIVAYKLWNANDLDSAIPVAERGLELATQKQDTNLMGRLKNSLAYYYALTKNPNYEDKARQYVTAARTLIPDMIMEVIDTEGLVRIVYGKTLNEVTEGVDLTYQAAKALSRIEEMPERLALAAERMKALKKGAS